MTNSSYTHLMSPLKIGSMSLKNRLVMSPMTTSYGNDDHTASDRLIAYLETRARGGVGLITVELTTVDINHGYMLRSMTLGEDQYIDHHRRITDAIHQHDAKCQLQISHTGPESISPLSGATAPIGPSVNVAPVWGWASRPVTVEELPGIAIQYGETARRAREAGYDGIELHAAHCYNLLASFLSPFRNKRRDEYAGYSVDGRIKFVVEVLQEIKQRAGEDFPVTLSVSGYERTPGGRGIDDTAVLAPKLVAAGVDCFRVSGGISDSLVSQIVPRTEHGDALNASQAEAIKNVVDVPVMVIGRIHDPDLAESILAKGQADLIAMGRPFLADPELPNKIRSGAVADIRRCISCENCIDSMEQLDNLRCAVNPSAGREAELQLASTGPSKKVIVIGGGAGGMEAARLADLKGHRVVLFEQQQRLGGSLTLASTVHADNEKFLNFLRDQLKKSKVDIRLGCRVDAQMMARENPDAVIVATGAKVVTQHIPGDDKAHVLTGALMRQILSGDVTQAEAFRLPSWLLTVIEKAAPVYQRIMSPGLIRQLSKLYIPIGKEVAILGADLAATELAEFLAHRGRRVHLLDEAKRIAPEVGNKRRNEHMDRLDRLGVTVNLRVKFVAITESGVVIRSGEAGEKLVKADNVIIAGMVKADTAMAMQLSELGHDVYSIGDCTGLGLIAKATHTAAEVVSVI